MSTRLIHLDSNGALQEVSTANPLPVTAAFAGTSAVGVIGQTSPTSADQIGWSDGSGNLTNVSAAAPLPVSATLTAEEIVANVVGNATSAAVLSNFPLNPTTGFRTAAVQVTSAGAGCTLVCEQSNDGTSWYGIQTPTDLTVEAATPLTAVGLYTFPIDAKQFRVRCSVYGSGTPAVNVEFRQGVIDYALESRALGASSAVIGHVIVDSGSITANAGTNLNTSALSLEATQSAFKTANHTDTIAITAALGSPFQAGGSIGNTTFASTQSGVWTVGISAAQTIAVTNAGTFAVQAAQAGTWNITNVSGTISLPTGAATAAKQPALGTAGTASTDVISIQGIASMTKLLVTPDSVALPANQSVNAAQVGGTNTDTNSGNKSAGTLRVVLATDQPALTNKLLVTPDSVALPANQSVNVSQVNGTTVLVNTGAVGTGSQRIAVGTDTATVAGSAPGSAGSPNVFVGVSGAAASGASTVGNPLLHGGRGATANPTAVADGQAVATMHDKLGKLVAVGAIRTLKGTQKTTISNSTSETTIVTAVASTFLDLYGLVFANSGATTTKVDVRDTTTGSIIMTFEVPTLETRGFMVPVDSAVPQTSVNTNWTAQCTSATTALEVTALYVKNT